MTVKELVYELKEKLDNTDINEDVIYEILSEYRMKSIKNGLTGTTCIRKYLTKDEYDLITNNYNCHKNTLFFNKWVEMILNFKFNYEKNKRLSWFNFSLTKLLLTIGCIIIGIIIK